jgi:hypothetical protein
LLNFEWTFFWPLATVRRHSCTITMPQCSPELTAPHTSLRGLNQRTDCCTSLLHQWQVHQAVVQNCTIITPQLMQGKSCKTRYHTRLCFECGDQHSITVMCKTTGWVITPAGFWNKKTFYGKMEKFYQTGRYIPPPWKFMLTFTRMGQVSKF